MITARPTGRLAPTQCTSATLLADWSAMRITGLSNGTAVSQWDDVSGNGNHLVQASGGAQPTYRTADLWRPSVLFAGAHYLTCDSLAAALSGEDVAFTFFSVMRFTGLAATQRVMSCRTNPGPTGAILCDVTATGQIRHLRQGNSGSVLTVASAAGVIGTSGARIIVWRFAGTTTSILRDNESIASGAQNTVSVTPSLFTIGASRYSLIADYLNAHIMRCGLFLGNLSDGDSEGLARHLTVECFS